MPPTKRSKGEKGQATTPPRRSTTTAPTTAHTPTAPTPDPTPVTGQTTETPSSPAAKKLKKGQPQVPTEALAQFPTARVVTTFTNRYEHVCTAWANTNWLKDQMRADHPGRIVEVTTNLPESQQVWLKYQHGAHEHKYVYTDNTGTIHNVPGYNSSFTKAAKCLSCNEDVVYVDSPTVLRSHDGACKSRQKQAPLLQSHHVQPPHVQPVSTEMILEESAVRMLAAHALPFKFFASAAVQDFLKALMQAGGLANFSYGRMTMRNNTIELSDRERAGLVNRMQRYPVTLAGDGGTIKRRKLLAFSVGHKMLELNMAKGCFLWKLFTVSDQKTISVKTRTGKVLDDLRTKHVWVVCMVADNHGAMQTGFRSAGHERGIFVIRCACHNIQLLVKDLFEEMPNLRRANRVQEFLLMNTNHQQRKDDFGLNINRCTTRWHVQHDNLQQIFETRWQIMKVFQELGEEQFVAVDEAVHVLRPFKVASRILEKDGATQIDVLAVLCGLTISSSSLDQKVNTEKQKVTQALIGRMKKNFASEIILCCAFAIPGLFHMLKNKEETNYNLLPKQVTTPAVLLSDLTIKCCTKATLNYQHIFFASQGQNCTLTKKEIHAKIVQEVNDYIEASQSEHPKAYTSDEVELYWARHFSRMLYLSKFMQAVLVALPSEASCERVFSHSKLVLDETRMALHERPTEAQTFLKFNGIKRPQTAKPRDNMQNGAEEAGLLTLMSTLPTNWAVLCDVVKNIAAGFISKEHLNGNVSKEGWKEWKELMLPDEDEDGDTLGIEEDADSGDDLGDEDNPEELDPASEED